MLTERGDSPLAVTYDWPRAELGSGEGFRWIRCPACHKRVGAPPCSDPSLLLLWAPARQPPRLVLAGGLH